MPSLRQPTLRGSAAVSMATPPLRERWPLSAVLSAAAYIGPKGRKFVVVDLVAPCRHRFIFAVENRVAEPCQIVPGEFAQGERDAAGVDHVAAVARRAGVGIEI